MPPIKKGKFYGEPGSTTENEKLRKKITDLMRKQLWQTIVLVPGTWVLLKVGQVRFVRFCAEGRLRFAVSRR